MSSAMNKKCAREECGKTVYPMEQLQCLDKVYHKQCFKCTVCGMTLNMKSYKGYEKQPYCEAHYPKTVASAVSDTPEMRRLAENTKLQSQVQYHADYEKQKGTKIEIADDPELQRHKQNARVQSQAQYHGELDKKRQQEANRPASELANRAATAAAGGGGGDARALLHESEAATHFPAAVSHHHNDGACLAATAANGADTHGEAPRAHEASTPHHHRQQHQQHGTSGMPTFAAEAGERKESPYSQRLLQEAGTVVYSSEQGGRAPASNEQRKVGSIDDYDPMNNQWGTAAGGQPPAQPEAQKSPSKAGAAKAQASPGAAAAEAPVSRNAGFAVKALYDYTAADKDEVSFKENDVIVNCQKVDDGWMTGTVQRTLMWGMLPANYVEKVNQPTGLFKLS